MNYVILFGLYIHVWGMFDTQWSDCIHNITQYQLTFIKHYSNNYIKNNKDPFFK